MTPPVTVYRIYRLEIVRGIRRREKSAVGTFTRREDAENEIRTYRNMFPRLTFEIIEEEVFVHKPDSGESGD